MTTLVRRLLRFAPVLALAWLVLSTATPASADSACFQDLNACFGRAGQIPSAWDSFLAALDCEVNFVSCLERALEK